jgi:hypothetical protein
LLASGPNHLIKHEGTNNAFDRNYIPMHDDDVSLRSEDYSGISTQELLDILEDVKVDNENVPEFIALHLMNLNNKRNQGVESQEITNITIPEYQDQEEELQGVELVQSLVSAYLAARVLKR